MSTPETIQDEWARWLLHRRHGGDPETQKAMLADLYQVRDKVLAHAQVAAGDVLLDVGAGDGLIAFSRMSKLYWSCIETNRVQLCKSATYCA
jgi:hypothetical protein